MKIKELKDADLSKVELVNGLPHCKLHGAMNQLTQNGIWRCVTTYSRTKDNNCDAGCQEE